MAGMGGRALLGGQYVDVPCFQQPIRELWEIPLASVMSLATGVGQFACGVMGFVMWCHGVRKGQLGGRVFQTVA